MPVHTSQPERARSIAFGTDSADLHDGQGRHELKRSLGGRTAIEDRPAKEVSTMSDVVRIAFVAPTLRLSTAERRSGPTQFTSSYPTSRAVQTTANRMTALHI